MEGTYSPQTCDALKSLLQKFELGIPDPTKKGMNGNDIDLIACHVLIEGGIPTKLKDKFVGSNDIYIQL